MADVSMRRMLEAGVHFGHQTRFWNPKMAPYIFGERNNIHIVNLEKTLPMYQEAVKFVRKVVADGGTVLFVGSKRSAQDSIVEHATSCGMPYVSHRWLGGMLTNFKTIRQSVERLHELEKITTEDSISEFTKKELLVLSREKEKLERSLGGIKHMESLPDVVFIIDVGHEEIAVREANKLGIAVVAVVDTNCSPDNIDYLVPGNDDAMRSIDLYVSGIADAVLKGKASIPEVPSGEDDFVELDEEGRPKESNVKNRPRSRSKKSVQVTKKSSTRKAIASKEDIPAQKPSQETTEPTESMLGDSEADLNDGPTLDEPVVQVEQAEDIEGTKVLQSPELPEEKNKPTKKKVAKKKPTSKKVAVTKKKRNKKAAPKKTSSEGVEES